MEKPKSRHSSQQSIYQNALQTLQNPSYNPESHQWEAISSILRNCDFFRKKFLSPVKLNDFIQLAKPHVQYEIFEYGTVLIKEKAHAGKFYIVLKGTLNKLYKRSNNDIEEEVKLEKRRSSIAEQILQRSSQKSPTSPKSSSLTPSRRSSFYQRSNPPSIKNMTSIFKQTESPNEPPRTKKSSIFLHLAGLGSDSPSSNSKKESPTWSLFGTRDELKINRSPSSKTNSYFLQNRQETEESPKSSLQVNTFEEASASFVTNLTQEETTFIKYVASKTPDVKKHCYSENVIRVSKNKTYTTGDFFGENIAKKNQPRENSMVVVSSDDAHLLTLAREDFLSIMSQLEQQSNEKEKLFEELFPDFDPESIKKFSYLFSRQSLLIDETIYSQGDISGDLYLVLSGEVKLINDLNLREEERQTTTHKKRLSLLPLSKGKEMPVVSVVKGQFFGEEILIGRKRRYNTAIANSPNTVIYGLNGTVYEGIKEDFEGFFKGLRSQAQGKFAWRELKNMEFLEVQKPSVLLQSSVSPKNSKNGSSPKGVFSRRIQEITKEREKINTPLNDSNISMGFTKAYLGDKKLLSEEVTPEALNNKSEIYKSRFSRIHLATKGDEEERSIGNLGKPDMIIRRKSEAFERFDLVDFNLRKEFQKVKTFRITSPKSRTSPKFLTNKKVDSPVETPPGMKLQTMAAGFCNIVTNKNFRQIVTKKSPRFVNVHLDQPDPSVRTSKKVNIRSYSIQMKPGLHFDVVYKTSPNGERTKVKREIFSPIHKLPI